MNPPCHREVNCVFCDKELEPEKFDGEHHIIPKSIRKIMRWTGNQGSEVSSFSVPMCRRCHNIFTELQKPLILIIRQLREVPPITLDLPRVLEGIMTVIKNQSSGESIDE